MAFRRRELVDIGGFSTEFGKRGNALVIATTSRVACDLHRRMVPKGFSTSRRRV
jgi:hypothetical protein